MKMLATADDQELIKNFMTGQDAAFQELMSRHRSQLYYGIYCLVKDNHLTEDILQEVFFQNHKINKGRAL